MTPVADVCYGCECESAVSDGLCAACCEDLDEVTRQFLADETEETDGNSTADPEGN